MPERLTEALVRGLGPGAHRDTAVRGMMVVVNKRSASYAVQRDLYRGRTGRRQFVKTVRCTLGRVGDMTLDDARTRAMEVIAQIKRGIDPNARPEEPGADGWTLGRLWSEYEADLRVREAADATVADFLDLGRRYLGDLLDLPLAGLKRSLCRDRHRSITRNHGPVSANRTFRALRAAYNFALRTVDDPDALPDNPVKAVTFNRERRKEAVILPEDLPDWYERVQKLNNPIRREIPLLGLLSGLRPGNLVSIEREWIRLDDRAIHIPRTKARRPFDLPLSKPMVTCVERALAAGDMLHHGSSWLFPTRNKAGQQLATQVWREKSLPTETGHILRHTYRTLAHAAGINAQSVLLLMDHKVPGITGVYLHDRALFDTLLDEQERISEYVFTILRT